MASSHPLVVAMLYPGDDDPYYQLKCQAYGIEMQIDDEWPAELVLLTPPEYLSAVTEETDVTGEDAAIVSAGVTDLQRGSDGQPDPSLIRHPRNNWLLVGHPSAVDSADEINLKTACGVQAGARLIVCLTSISDSHIAARLTACSGIGGDRLVVAFVPPT